MSTIVAAKIAINMALETAQLTTGADKAAKGLVRISAGAQGLHFEMTKAAAAAFGAGIIFAKMGIAAGEASMKLRLGETSADDFARSLAESIPVVGIFVRGVGGISEAIWGEKAAAEMATRAIKSHADGLEVAAARQEKLTNATREGVDAINDMARKSQQAAALAGLHGPAHDAMAEQQRNEDAQKEILKQREASLKAAGATDQDLKNAQNWVGLLGGSDKAPAAALASLKVIEDARRQIEDATTAAQTVAENAHAAIAAAQELNTQSDKNDAVGKLISGAENQGLTERERALKTLGETGVETAEDIMRLNDAFDAIEAQTSQDNIFKIMQQDADAMFASTRTPLEQLQSKFKNIAELLDAGLIDDTTAERAQRAAQEAAGKEMKKLGDTGDTSKLSAAREIRFMASIPAFSGSGKDAVAAKTAESSAKTADATSRMLQLMQEQGTTQVVEIAA